MPKQTEKTETQTINHITRMVIFTFTLLDSKQPVRGVPNIQDFSQDEINPEWESGNVEIRMQQENYATFLNDMGKAYRADNDIEGAFLIKRISDTEYYMIPVGTPDFILKAREIAKYHKIQIVE